MTIYKAFIKVDVEIYAENEKHAQQKLQELFKEQIIKYGGAGEIAKPWIIANVTKYQLTSIFEKRNIYEDSERPTINPT